VAAGGSSNGRKTALGVAVIGAAATITAAIITRCDSDGNGNVAPTPMLPSTSQSPAPTNTATPPMKSPIQGPSKAPFLLPKENP
jgi:hypothetical protein